MLTLRNQTGSEMHFQTEVFASSFQKDCIKSSFPLSCYYLYKRPGFKATSRLITPSMGSVTGDTIGFKIRSIERVYCEEAVV